MFSILKNPPTLELRPDDNAAFDKPVIIIGDGQYMIIDTEIENVRVFARTQKVPGFALLNYYPATHWEPEEYDYKEVCPGINFVTLAIEAVKEYVGNEVAQTLEAEATFTIPENVVE